MDFNKVALKMEEENSLLGSLTSSGKKHFLQSAALIFLLSVKVKGPDKCRPSVLSSSSFWRFKIVCVSALPTLGPQHYIYKYFSAVMH